MLGLIYVPLCATICRHNYIIEVKYMVITFCGHSKFQKNAGDEKKILSILEKEVGNKSCDAYLGDFGEYDMFAYHCCKKYKESHPNLVLVFVTPYLNVSKHHNVEFYDDVLYPPIERKPLRYAISYRNQYMVEKADLIIAYVAHPWGGAYQTCNRTGLEPIRF